MRPQSESPQQNHTVGMARQKKRKKVAITIQK